MAWLAAYGQIDIYLANTIVSVPHIKAGKLKAIATGRIERLPMLPDVPSFHEQGLKGLEIYGWQALAAPAGTPAEFIDRLNKELNKLLTTGETARKLAEMGAEAFPTTPAEISARAQADFDANQSLIERLGLREN